eukprot:102950-Prorocentrum_lima.AAC.1
MTSSLVGSEMCIRDRSRPPRVEEKALRGAHLIFSSIKNSRVTYTRSPILCLLYTSDAADDM